MSKLYTLIEKQVNALTRFVLEDDRGQVNYGSWIKGPKFVQPVITAITLFLYVLIIMMFGLFLWNSGLHAAMPAVFARIDPANMDQSGNAYMQLLITLMALYLIF